MNAVSSPGGGSFADAVGSENTVERDERIGSELTGDLNLRVEVNAEEVLIRRGEQELFQNDDLSVGLFLDFGQAVAVAFFKIFMGHPVLVAGTVPGIVDADQDGYEIRLMGDAVFLPAVTEIFRAVAADAEVDEFKIGAGMTVLDEFCGELRVTVAEIVDVRAVASCIGDAVALE